MKVSTILDQIDLGSMALPEFQRGYVWRRWQVRDLMYSLYNRCPVGSLLVWVTRSDTARTRGSADVHPGSVELLLDGQQRITSLYGIIRGRPPEFFDGDANAFTDLQFHLEDEVFEFYAPMRMKDNPLWIDVTRLMKDGIAPFFQDIMASPEFEMRQETYLNRLNCVAGISQVDFHIDKVTGEDKDVDTVVDIFNRVNSGGTKLSKGDLALAKICARWPDARKEMKECLSKWQDMGYSFKLDWFLRNTTTALTGQAFFSMLRDVDMATFKEGVRETEKAINHILNLIAGRLGLDHDRVLGGRYAFPVMARYLATRGGIVADARERDMLLYWYIQSFLWGRYAGSTESILNQDLAVMSESSEPIEDLIRQLDRWRGSLQIRPEDFAGWSRGARFYPMLYMLTRVGGARDWGSGIPLSAHLLGKDSALQLHHIFPKARLYDAGYSRSEVNALANFCFLTQTTNLKIGARLPAEYLEEIDEAHPGALESQWIPKDCNLWRTENYRDFLAQRQQLLSEAANDFLDGLYHGNIDEIDQSQPRAVAVDDTLVVDDDLQALLDWIRSHRLDEPELDYEIYDEERGEAIAIVDLAWPYGIQEGYGQPLALVIERGRLLEDRLNELGFIHFRTIDGLQGYLRRYILEASND